MTWALRRQIFYVSIFVSLLLILGFFTIYPKLQRLPTCSDGIQNGEESGIDCGGACSQICLKEVDDISLLWSRAFRVVPGRYNAVAYLVNHNKNAAIKNINYRFRFADENNVYIGKREGTVSVPPTGKFAVFAPAVDLGYSVPVYVSFEFTSVPKWEKVPEEMMQQLKILLSNIVLRDETTKPVLSATLRNSSLFTIPEVDVVAILYDATGNAVSVSSTFVEEFKREQTKDVSFTWPEPFGEPIVAKEIIPMYNVFGAKLK